jgi:aromatic ring-cleaving dioxygenase
MIQTYHAHVYFNLAEMALAAQVRNSIIKQLPQLTYAGQLIPMSIGPHPQPMFEIHIPASSINFAMATINELREGFSVLVHPVQVDELAAHTSGASWLGEQLSLKLDVLK